MNSSQRKASHAGSWYPKSSEELKELIESFKCEKLASAISKPDVIVVPHAGYRFSGKVAKSAFCTLEGHKYARIFIIGPSHHSYLGNSIGLSCYQELETPFGNLNVDWEFIGQMIKMHPKLFHFLNSKEDLEEHSLEMQFPFIYHVFANSTKVIPMLISAINEKAIEALKRHLQDSLFVVSSDFCHWGKRFGFTPHFTCIDSGIRQLNMQAIEILLQGKDKEFEEYLQRTGNTICGQIPLLFCLKLMNLKGKLLDYANSGSVFSPEDSSVSYAAIVMNKT